jgi:hypothetical protein
MKNIGIISLSIINITIFVSISAARINPSSCVAAWLFDEGEGAQAFDASDKGHDGTISGAKWVAGKFGQALAFDGADDVVSVGDVAAFTLAHFTLVAWFNCAGPNNQWQGIVGKDTWPVRNYSLYIHRDTKTLGSNFVHDANPDAHKEVIATTQVMDGNWHHGAVTYDMNHYKIYTDGVLEKEIVVTNEPDENNLPVRIGMEGAFNGIIDEVAIFNVALAEDDIKRIALTGLEKALSITAVDRCCKLSITWCAIKQQ